MNKHGFFMPLLLTALLAGCWTDNRQTMTTMSCADIRQGEFLDLGTLGGKDSFATGVSADGSVVVGVSEINNDGKTRHAFRWTAQDGMQDLGTLGGAESSAQDISSDGRVIVGYSATRSGKTDAFRWTVESGMQDLGSLGDGSQAKGVSADGRVVVGTYRMVVGNYGNPHPHRGREVSRAFRWTAEEGMQDLGALGGKDVSSEAEAVSADGRVVVGRSWTGDIGIHHAFRWTAEGGMQDLGVLGDALGYPLSHAHDVSADGGVVIGVSDVRYEKSKDIYESGTVIPHAFRWTVNGGMQDLDAPGDMSSVAFGLSADGCVTVGERVRPLISPVGTKYEGWRAYLWGANGGKLELGALGSVESEAIAASADGSVIVGSSSLNDYKSHAFRWIAGGRSSARN
ncbi:MAG: hypothetical protein LBE62_01365 [Azonexus sp.]|jgi:probable HAF family extracellular repeat protein|nr:hypothetical protein [Azonexus sp.]